MSLLDADAPKPHLCFEQYPAKIWKGNSAIPRFTTKEEILVRTNLQEAARRPPNFAGHYRFATWGRGTRCISGAIIDLTTGKIYSPPLARKVSGEEHWIFCTDWDKEHGAEYRSNSRLMIIHCGHHFGEYAADIHFLVWERNHFKELLRIVGPKPN